MNINRKTIFATFAVVTLVDSLMLFHLNTPSTTAETPSTVLYLAPSMIDATPNMFFSVSLNIENVINLCAWEARLKWDPQILELINVTSGGFLNPEEMYYVINQTEGDVFFYQMPPPTPPGVNGSGTLANLLFLGIGQKLSGLSLYGTKLFSSKPEEVSTPPNLGDANYDGIVDVNDVKIVLLAFGTSAGNPGYNPNADFNADGVVDVFDWLCVVFNFGRSYPLGHSVALKPVEIGLGFPVLFAVTFDDNLAFYRGDIVYMQGQKFEIAAYHDINTVVTLVVTDPNQTYGTTGLTWISVTNQPNPTVLLTVIKVSVPSDAPIGNYTMVFILKYPDGTILTYTCSFDLQLNVQDDPKWTDKEKTEYHKGSKMKYGANAKSPAPNKGFCQEGWAVITLVTDKELDAKVKKIVNGVRDATTAADKKVDWVFSSTQWVYNPPKYTDTKKFLKKVQEAIGKTPPQKAPGQCNDFAALLTALLRKEGIPARPVCGVEGVDDWRFHCWVEFWDGTAWEVVDAMNNVPKSLGGGYVQKPTDPETYWNNRKWPKTGKVWTYDGSKWSDITDTYYKTHSYYPVRITPSTSKPLYLLGDNATVNIEFTNLNMTHSKTISYSTLIEKFPETYADVGTSYILNETGTITILPGSSLNVSRTLTRSMYRDNGHYLVTVATNVTAIDYPNETASNSTTFDIQGGLNLSLSMPSAVNENQTFNLAFNITNILPTPVNNINVSLSFPYFSSVSDFSFNVTTLFPGKVYSVTLPMSISQFGDWSIWITASSNDSGFVFQTFPVKVLSPRLLDVTNDNSPQDGITVGQIFVISSQIDNLGDYPINGLSVTLQPYGGFSTTEPLTKSIGNLLGGESKTVSWTVVARTSGTFAYTISAVDTTDRFNDTKHALVSIYSLPPPPGGIGIPVDKLALLAPYIGLASTITVAAVAVAVHVKRVKHRKEKQ
jgi:transglutaminase-like putative cysteine protease